MSSRSVLAASLASVLFTGAAAAGAGFNYISGSKDPPGPEYWAAIPGTECDGSSQSPIDLPPPPSFFTCGNLRGSAPETNYTEPGSCPMDFPTPVFEPGCCTFADVTFTIDSAAVKLSYPSAGCDRPAMTMNGERWSVLQWHSHERSEHLFAGEHLGGVIHIVHVSDSDPSKLAVIGVTLSTTNDENNEALEPYYAQFQAMADAQEERCMAGGGRRLDEPPSDAVVHLPRQLAINATDATLANPYAFVPEGSNFFTYAGSLTTPPCSEIVTWFVLEDPLPFSIMQFTALESWVLNHKDEDCERDTIASVGGDTFRPTQPLNGRTVRYCETA